MPIPAPFAVVPFINRSGSESFRVMGSWRGRRIRKNFSQRANADAFCNAKNAEALQSAAAIGMWLVQTRLTERDVRVTEAAVDRIDQRWGLREVLDCGIATLSARPAPKPVADLAEEWLMLMESAVSARWWGDLGVRLRLFVRQNPGLTTAQFNRAFMRGWLDRLDVAPQTKANYRNAVHRFGGWLVERGFMPENPAAAIRITRRRSGAQQGDQALPTVFSALQAEALLRACEGAVCRRLLGWMASCLTTGLRPESEAPRATWAEINFKTAEWTVMGRKRGAKPRIVKLQPAALAWLKVVKADGMAQPAFYLRHLRRKAVEAANVWLAKNWPAEKPIVWDEDITRHTFASYRSPQIPVHDLAGEMGNSPGTIYAHYRHPRSAADVKAFWALRPAR